MTKSERISKWRGEKYKGYTFVNGGSYPVLNTSPDYSTDPSAWTPALYQAIEDAGIHENFSFQLSISTGGPFLAGLDSSGIAEVDYEELFTIIRATPAQKATALARAIEEMEGQNE